MAISENHPTPLSTILTILGIALMFTGAARAVVSEKVVLSFNGATGRAPSGLSMDATGNLWGVTILGGTGDCSGVTVWGCGTVFELTPASDGWKPKSVYSFQGGQDGAYPTGNLAFDAEGNVYGVTGSGGMACQCGTVYKLTPQSGRYKETVIYRFNDTPFHNDGSGPSGGLVMDTAGHFYGTAGGGNGCSFGCGTVFKLSPAGGGWTESILYNFKGDSQGALDGWGPLGPLVLDGRGNLYGTALGGGTSENHICGMVFELSSDLEGGWTESILYNFEGNQAHDGRNPVSGLVVDAAGNLYGTTHYGGSSICSDPEGCGTVFELSPAGAGAWTETVIHSFSYHDGREPTSGLVISATGSLYGVTDTGGVFSLGIAFELTPGSGGIWTESILHNFGNGKDGSSPSAALVFDSAGNLYGTTYLGGAGVNGLCEGGGCGTVFQLTP